MTDINIWTGPGGLANPLLEDFWRRPAPEIDADLKVLRDQPPTVHPEREREDNGLLPPATEAWVVTRHADILQMSKNPQTFSSANGITVLDSPPEFNAFFSSMIAMDDPRHARLRKLVSAGFTPGMMKRLEDGVQELATQIVDDLIEKGEFDFVVDGAAALPLRVVCDLMGIPESHYEFVFDQTNVILGAGDSEYVEDSSDIVTALLTAGGNLAELMNDVATSLRGGDGTDLTSKLINAELQDDRLEPADLASFFILLVVAGNETTRNSISWGLQYLTQNPDQRQIWLDDLDGVTNTAVEEIVRLASPVAYMRRTITEDTELGGVGMKAGEKACMFYLAANRDEELFPDPLKFDVRRDPNPHIGFGGPGPHFCLGAHLARRQIAIMYRELLTRAPDIHATGEPDLLASSFIHGIKHLPASI